MASSPHQRRHRRDSQRNEYSVLEARNLLASIATIDVHPSLDYAVLEPVETVFTEQENVVRKYLARNPDTSYLQEGLSGVRPVAVETVGTQTTTVFQQTFHDLPIYNAYITVVQNEKGRVEGVFDRGHENLSTYVFDGPLATASQAEFVANEDYSRRSELTIQSEPVWYYYGNRARLGWKVDTFIGANANTEVDSDFVSIVDIYSQSVVSQERTQDVVSELIANPEIEEGIFPRIVINDTIGPAGSREYASTFDSVAALALGCTGTLIAPDVVLSARHCGAGAGDRIFFGDDSDNPDFIATVQSVLLPDGNGSLLDGGDVAILTLTADVPASIATPMRLIDATDALVGQVAATVGYGFNGVGSSGHGNSSDGLRWGGENIIDVYGSPAGNNGSNIISTDFDDGSAGANTIDNSDPNPLEFEATTAPGDSGGPVLVQVGNEWVIAGVLSGGTTSDSRYGDISWWTGTAIYRTQIEAAGGVFVDSGVGSVSFDRNAYSDGDTAEIRVTDNNGVDPLIVTLTSDSGDTETLTLTQGTGPTFDGNINVSVSNVTSGDGVLQVSVGDQITVTYVDPDDGEGNSETVSDTAEVIELSTGVLAAVDFDEAASGSPLNWFKISDDSNSTYNDLGDENGGATGIDLTIVESVDGFWGDFEANPSSATIPQHTNPIPGIDGQIFTGGDTIVLTYSDLTPLQNYEIYVFAIESFFTSIQQQVTITGAGAPVTFTQSFGSDELFVNDQLGDSTRSLSEYAQAIQADASGEIVVTVEAIAGSSDLVLAGISIVEVNAAPIAVNDTAITDEDSLVNISVLTNDSDPDGDTFSIQSVTDPANGTATINGDGTIDYSPVDNFFGEDVFEYTIVDEVGNTASAEVRVTVEEVADAPTDVLLSNNSISENTDTSLGPVEIGVLDGVDVDSDTFTFTLVSGAGDSDNGDFEIDGDRLRIRQGTEIDFETQELYSVRVEVSDGTQSFSRSMTIDVINRAEIVGLQIGDGTDQRSILQNIVISFDERVTLGGAAFELIKRGPDGGAIDVLSSLDNSSGQSVVTLSFQGSFVDSQSGSLTDGNYQLTVFGSEITSEATGEAIDGNGDGAPGGDRIVGDTEQDRFFRFFGDVDGDRVSSSLDLLRFRQTWQKEFGDTAFDDRFDFDDDGVISSLDLLRFRGNFGETLDFE